MGGCDTLVGGAFSLRRASKLRFSETRFVKWYDGDFEIR